MPKKIQSYLGVSPELAKLLEAARDHELTDEERWEQRISFAYGNLALDDPSITKDQVRAEAEKLYGKGEPDDGG